VDQRMSESLFARALKSIPGGVNSPVRSFRAVDVPPLFIEKGNGPFLYDVDSNRYIDYLMSWGAIILGHRHEAVRYAIEQAANRGTTFGLSNKHEYELAELIKDAFPSIDLLRLVNSGTEAVMSSVRLARGYTGRDKVVMFEGCYHGHSDGLLAKAGSGISTFGIPGSAGVPPAFTNETLVVRFNDLEDVEAVCKAHGDDIACILVEPVAGNMGVVPPVPGFLQGLRDMCDQVGALLIFDEVITGFRIAWGGAQERYGVQPDLTVLGKIIGGGLPIGAFGGKRNVMEKVSPLGKVYQAGTLSGNALVVSAGKAALHALRQLDPYNELDHRTIELTEAFAAIAEDAFVPLQTARVGPMFTLYFSAESVTDYESAQKADVDLYGRFFRQMLKRGVLLPPSQWETAFVGLAHTQGVIAQTIARATEAIPSLAQEPTGVYQPQ